MSANNLEFRLMGGVGNQLFISTFAALLSEQFGHHGKVVLNSTELAAQSHGSGLENLNLEKLFGDLGRNLEFRNSPFFFSRLVDRLRFSRTWEPKEIGFIGNPGHSIPAGTQIVRGYFQSSTYVQQLRELGAPLVIEPKNPSDEYCRAKEDVNWNEVGVIHVRRGDYFALQESFGVLAASYFGSGVDVLKRKGFSVFLVMSDSPEASAILEAEIPATNFLSMSDFSLKSAEEELSLASRAGAIVMSNSSFSFWAAFGGTPKTIVAPSPWFKGLAGPEKLLHSFLGFEVQLLTPSWDVVV